MKNVVAGLVLLLLVFSGCTQPAPDSNPSGNNALVIGDNGDDGDEVNVLDKTVESGDTVKVEYEGTLENGEVFDSTERQGGTPLEFVAGAGQMIRGFDAAVIGMKVGGEKTVTLAPKDAYGEKEEGKISEVSKDALPFWDTIFEGMPVYASNGLNGTVLEVKEDSAIIDFNHKLAGKALIFKIKVVGVEKA